MESRKIFHRFKVFHRGRCGKRFFGGKLFPRRKSLLFISRGCAQVKFLTEYIYFLEREKERLEKLYYIWFSLLETRARAHEFALNWGIFHRQGRRERKITVENGVGRRRRREQAPALHGFCCSCRDRRPRKERSDGLAKA